MPMTIYKLFASASGDDAASLDIQMDGEIKSIHMSMMGAAVDALNDDGQAELSFLSTSSFNSNDTRGSLMIVQFKAGILTQGGLSTGVNASISSLEIPVAAGERVHLHLLVGGGTGAIATHAFMYIQDKGIARIAGRRR